MRIPRFFVFGKDLSSLQGFSSSPREGDYLELVERDLIHRLRNVLRLKEGSAIRLAGSGHDLVFEIDDCQNAQISCRWLGVAETRTELANPVTIAACLIKGERFDWCLEKLTELGVHTVVPLVSERTVVKMSELNAKRSATKLERWQVIARESAEQSERATIPQVVTPRSFKDFVQQPGTIYDAKSESHAADIHQTDSSASSHLRTTANHGTRYTTEGMHNSTKHLRIICAERVLAPRLQEVVERFAAGRRWAAEEQEVCPAVVSAVVGPEGGFTDNELAEAVRCGWLPVSLGRRILRAETACMSVMAQLASQLDY